MLRNIRLKLSNKDIKYLRGLAHSRKIIVSIGNNGITKGVVNELDTSLHRHELIKIKLTGDSLKERKICLERLCSAVDAQFVQLIGKVGVVYRQSASNSIVLPH